MHPMQQVIGELRGSETRFPPLPAQTFHEAVSRYGIGLDHLGGEIPLAFLSGELPKPYTMSFVATDRRILGRVWASDVSDTTSDIPYAWLRDVKKGSGFLLKPLDVAVGDRVVKLHVFADTFERFLRRVMQLPVEMRGYPPLAPQATEADPTAAMAASHFVLSGDPRVATLIRAIHGAHAQGWYSQAEAYDLVGRALLLDRTIAHGRGMRLGWWQTIAPRPLLAQLFPAMLGQPQGAWSEGGNDTLDFPIGGSRSSNLGANVVGLALFATIGIGFYRRNVGGPALQGIRIVLSDNGYTLSGFAGGVWVPLSTKAPGLVDAVSQTILALDARVLLAQVAFGPQTPALDLVGHPPDVLQSRISQAMGGPVDISGFFPRS
ncbi:MAG: hypothetical protein ACXWUG_05425 [Polyangiales bacterium]